MRHVMHVSLRSKVSTHGRDAFLNDTSQLVAQAEPTSEPVGGVKQIVNDFSIQIATVNGSGSQSANSVLLRSIFRMGVPVSGKNLFPSNIAGLPTWYTIRVSKDGWVARKTDIDLLIAMNAETAREDVLSLARGRRGDLRRSR